MASRVSVEVQADMTDWRAVDARPQFIAERKSLEDFGIFATPLARTEEIIVEPDTVESLLAKIREMQAPALEAAHQRQKLRRTLDEGVDPAAVPPVRQRFHAQILSIAA